MKRATLSVLIAAFIVLNCVVVLAQEYPQPSIPNGAKIVCIYAVGQEQTPVLLGEEWLNMWNDEHIPGLPSYTGHVSMGQYMLHGAAITNNGYPFVSELYNTPSHNNPVWEDFGKEMVEKADVTIDFSGFANEQGIVLAVIVCPVKCGNGVPTSASVLTNDYYNGTRVRVNILSAQTDSPSNSAAALVIHEFGHLLGFPDIGYGETHLGLGGYDVMGASDPGMGFWLTSAYVDKIPSPYNPARRVRYGWLACEEIFASTPGFHVKDISEGIVYKIASPGIDPAQYFLLSNHNRHLGYEQCWPGQGLLIWHINDNTIDNDPRNSSYWTRPRAHPADIECAYGLWDWVQPDNDTWVPTNPNPTTGRDSLDIRGIYNPIGQTIVNPVGSPSDFFPGSTNNQEFSPKSNPSSNFYRMADGYPEDLPSNISLRNIIMDEATGDIVIDIDLSLVPPSAPSRPDANNTSSLCNTDLVWQQNPPEQEVIKYEIYQGEYSNESYTDPVLVGTSTVTLYPVVGLAPGKIYYFQLKAVDKDRNHSSFSEKTLVSTYQRANNNGNRCLAHEVRNLQDVWYSCNVRQNVVSLTTYGAASGAVSEQITQGGEASLGRSGNNLMAAVTCRINNSTQALYGYWRPVNSPGSWTEVPIYTHTGDSVYIGSPSIIIDASGNAHITWVSCVGLKPDRPNMWWRWTYTVNYCCTGANFQSPHYMAVKSYQWVNDEFDPADAALYGASIANGYDGPNVIWARQGSIYHSRKSGGLFSAATALHDCAATGVYAIDPYIDAKINGTTDRICAVWAANILSGSKNEIVRKEYVGGSWSATVNVSNTPGYDSRHPQVAVNNLNEYGFIWQEEQGTSNNWDIMIDYFDHQYTTEHHDNISQDDLISFGPQVICCTGSSENEEFFVQWYTDKQCRDRSSNQKKPYSTPSKSTSIGFGNAGNPSQHLPVSTLLGRSAPNPFSQGTTIHYQLAKSGTVSIHIYNVSGQRVCKLVEAVQQPGYYTANWNGKDDRGQKLGNGIYLVNLRAEGVSSTNRMILVR